MEKSGWNPAIHLETQVAPDDAEPGLVGWRHPLHPFVGAIHASSDSKRAVELQSIAQEYLGKVLRGGLFPPGPAVAQLDVIRKWLSQVDKSSRRHDRRFAWLEPAGLGRQRRNSKRTPPSISSHPSVVLYAGELVVRKARQPFPIDSGFGWRVVGHIRPGQKQGDNGVFAITSFAASLPFGRWRERAFSDSKLDELLDHDHFMQQLRERRPDLEAMAQLNGLRTTGLRVCRGDAGDDVDFELHCTGDEIAANPDARPRVSHALVLVGTARTDGTIRHLHASSRRPLVACAAPPLPKLFVQDPASMGSPATFRKRSPRQPDRKLSRFRKPSAVPALIASDLAVDVAARTRPQLQLVSTSGIRSEKHARDQATLHLGGFLARMDRWGLSLRANLPATTLPLKARVHSGIRPGPGKDGMTVNARVTQQARGTPLDGQQAGQGGEITMHFAMADLIRRVRGSSTSDRIAPAHYLSIAADARWVWHEIAHALIAGSTGELELRFAHSAGDALAAIAMDPSSTFQGPARGATFPWVFLPRRHDRWATRGWSWSGSMHLPATMRADPNRPALKGYWSEQILSSTLFRLYRSLGGDSIDPANNDNPHIDARSAASDYTLYLIIRAITKLSDHARLTGNSPDHFVTALTDSDIEAVRGIPDVPGGNGNGLAWAGGCAHKVIRWAFERQGLYAEGFSNGPGLPPAVDLYIPDCRPASDPWGEGPIPFGPGEYGPVSLYWDAANEPLADWHASNEGIHVENGEITVEFGNRGAETAHGIEVRVRVLELNQANPVEQWQGLVAWTELTPVKYVQSLAPGGTQTVGPWNVPPGLTPPFAVIAEVSCDADRANTHPGTGLACRTEQFPIARLIAGDNNLGFRYVPS